MLYILPTLLHDLELRRKTGDIKGLLVCTIRWWSGVLYECLLALIDAVESRSAIVCWTSERGDGR